MHSTQHYGTGQTPLGGAEVTIAEGHEPPPDPRVPFQRGEVLGRYVVLDTLGAGGMGIVLAAYDSTLDRRVALKLLHPHASRDPESHTRLLREAQALAKLSHPAVVSVYDVGELRGQVFIAMEFIDGPNLRHWTRHQRPRPKQVIAAFRNAAAGLQAAHDAGIVHRDFKPDNVLIGPDRRAYVTDFGLALEAHLAVTPGTPSASASASGSPRLTETGMVMGTPAYMPVEQHRGLPTDHRSDQFSFAVSFYEALYGVRPFSGTNAGELCRAITQADIPPPPPGIKVPRRVHRAILRALSAAPSDRFPSMRAFLRAITPPTRSRRTWIFGGIGGLALGAGAVFLADPPQRPCSSFDERIADVYGPDQRAAIEAAFTTTDLPYARASFDATAAALDDYAQRWTEAATDACPATERGHQSDHMLDLRMHCLDRARSGLAASVDLLRDADDAVVRDGVAVASNQRELNLCSDLELLERSELLPDNALQAAESAALTRLLNRIEAMRSVGRKEEAKLLFSENATRLRASTHPPVAIHASWVRGRLAGTDNQAADAIEAFRRAHTLALEHGLDGPAASAAKSVAFYLSEFENDAEQAEHYLRVAMALARASGSPRTSSEVHNGWAQFHMRRSRFPEAAEAARKSLELIEQLPTPDPFALVHGRLIYAQAIRRRDGATAAMPLLDQAEATMRAAFGDTHPLLVDILQEKCNVAKDLGEYEDARTYALQALAQANEAYGEQSLDTAYVKANLASVLGALGDRQSGLRMLKDADAVFAKEYGEDHPVRARLGNNIASLYIEIGDDQAATEALREALRIARLHADGSGSVLAIMERNLALMLLEQGKLEDAWTHARAALESTRTIFGETHSEFALSLSVVGRAERARGQFTAARNAQERALAVGHERRGDAASIQLYLGRTLLEDPQATDDDRARGLSLVREAYDTLRTLDDVDAHLANARDILATHDPASASR